MVTVCVSGGSSPKESRRDRAADDTTLRACESRQAEGARPNNSKIEND